MRPFKQKPKRDPNKEVMDRLLNIIVRDFDSTSSMHRMPWVRLDNKSFEKSVVLVSDNLDYIFHDVNRTSSFGMMFVKSKTAGYIEVTHEEGPWQHDARWLILKTIYFDYFFHDKKSKAKKSKREIDLQDARNTYLK